MKVLVTGLMLVVWDAAPPPVPAIVAASAPVTVE
jgi:hypothetical protein